jgi:DNA-binding response OmpR family regulator
MGTGLIILVVQGAGRDRLANMLERNGFTVRRAHNGKQAVAQAKETPPALAMIDPSSLRINGARLCRMLKRATDSVPIIWVLDAGTTVSDDGGADLFLERPFTTRKLLNRVRKLLPPTEDNVLSAGDIVFDAEKREVRKGENKCRLTPKQAKLLCALMRQSGEVLSRRFLMKHVWNTDYLGDTRTLDVHVRWVREAIEDDPSKPKYLRTVRGVGYRFEVPEPETASSQD